MCPEPLDLACMMLCSLSVLSRHPHHAVGMKPALCCCVPLLPASRPTHCRLCATVLNAESTTWVSASSQTLTPKPQTPPPTWCKLLRIHLSLRHSPCQLLLLLKSALASRAHSPLACTPSSWKRMNFPAFHSLFAKFRLALTRSSDRLRSCPAAVPVVVGEQGMGGWARGGERVAGVRPGCAVSRATTSQLCRCLQHPHQNSVNVTRMGSATDPMHELLSKGLLPWSPGGSAHMCLLGSDDNILPHAHLWPW